MATTAQTASPDGVRRAAEPPGAGQAPPLDALHARWRLRRARRPDHRPRRGLLRLGRARQPLPRRPLGAVLRQRRPRAHRARRGGRAPGRGARLLHELELRAPARDRAGDADRLARAGRPEPRLLHLGRLGGGRVGDQAGARLPPADRRTRARPSSSPARSPTTARRWGRSPRPASRTLRTPFEPLVPGGLHVPNTNSYHWPADRDPLWAADQIEETDPLRGPRHGRRRDPRAAPERRRLHPAAGGLLPAGARDLRPPRRAADLRRGDLRLGPARPLVRLRALRLPARHRSPPPRR